MPARDSIHNNVRRALERDGWTITDGPLRLQLGKSKLYVDLGAERLLAAEKAERKIAVEIKTFAGPRSPSSWHHRGRRDPQRGPRLPMPERREAAYRGTPPSSPST
jgi:hypothetical protein